MNVWTHLCGFILVTALLVSTVITLSPYGLDRVEIVPAVPVPVPVTTSIPVTPGSDAYTGAAAAAAASNSAAPNDLSATATAATVPGNNDNPNPNPNPSSRTVWDRFLSSPELLSDAVSRLQRGDLLRDLLHVTERLRSKSATLATGVSDRFHAFVSECESRLARLQSVLSSSEDPTLAFKEYLVAQNEIAVDEFTQFYTKSRLDLIGYSQYLIDQFRHRGGTALKLLIATEPATVTTVIQRQQSSTAASSSASASSSSSASLGCRNDTVSGGSSNNDTLTSSVVNCTDSTGAVSNTTIRLVAHLPVWPISIFMVSAMCCLLFSTIYHLFSSHSEYIAAAFQRLDYAGICLLIAGSNVPVLYYGFECEHHLAYRYLYLTICSILGVGCFIITTTERFLHPRYRVLRTAAFVAMGVSGVIPACHLLLLGVQSVVFDLITMGACYLCGATIYLLRVPERFHPGKFDIFFTSHQLWHCFVAAAILLHYTAVLRFFQWRQLNACLPIPTV